jgi:hypothetical protein
MANPTCYDAVTIDIGGGLLFQADACFSSSMDFFALGLLGQRDYPDRGNPAFVRTQKPSAFSCGNTTQAVTYFCGNTTGDENAIGKTRPAARNA